MSSPLYWTFCGKFNHPGIEGSLLSFDGWQLEVEYGLAPVLSTLCLKRVAKSMDDENQVRGPPRPPLELVSPPPVF